MRRVGVVGAGVMGSGVAQTLAQTGTQVFLIDVSDDVLREVLDELRADPDWVGLYARLRPLSRESAGDATLSRQCIDTTLATQAAATYYPDFGVPEVLGTVTFLVQVPVKTVAGVAALREDEVAPRYGLPHDLNGDGVIDGNARDADYRALPIVVRLRWQRVGMPTSEVILATWLRGDR